MLVLALRW